MDSRSYASNTQQQQPSSEHSNKRKRSSSKYEEASSDNHEVDRPSKSRRIAGSRLRSNERTSSDIGTPQSTSGSRARGNARRADPTQPKRRYNVRDTMPRGRELLRRLGFFENDGAVPDNAWTIASEMEVASGETLEEEERKKIHNAIRKEISKSIEHFIGPGSQEAADYLKWRNENKHKPHLLLGSLVGKEGTGTTTARRNPSNSGPRNLRRKREEESEVVEEGRSCDAVEEVDEARQDAEVNNASERPGEEEDNPQGDAGSVDASERLLNIEYARWRAEQDEEIERQEQEQPNATRPTPDLATEPSISFDSQLHPAGPTEEDLRMWFPEHFTGSPFEGDGRLTQDSPYGTGRPVSLEGIFLTVEEGRSLLSVDWREVSPVCLPS